MSESGISLSNDDIDQEINRIIKESKEEESKIRDYFNNDNHRESLSSNLMNQKLFDYIGDFAIIKDKNKSTSELREQNKGK